MTHFETLPAWAALPIAILVVFGAGLTLIGAIGLWRMPSFYDRLHAPTLGTSWGTAGIVLASIIMFSVTGARAVIHESVIAVFIMLTTPVTLMLLGRAALHRDRVEGNVPFQFTREDEHEAKAAQQLAQAEARANMISAQEASLAAEKAAAEPAPAENTAEEPEAEVEGASADLRQGDAEAAAVGGDEAIADTSAAAEEAALPETISPESIDDSGVTPQTTLPRDLFPKPPDPEAAQGPHTADPEPPAPPKKTDPDLPEY